jgi:hypothetical protein
MSLEFDVFAVDPKPIPSAVPGFEEAVGQARWPPSTSTLISGDGGGVLIDCLIAERQGRELATWMAFHDVAPEYVYITHPYADHSRTAGDPGGVPAGQAGRPRGVDPGHARADLSRVHAGLGWLLSRPADRQARRAGAPP